MATVGLKGLTPRKVLESHRQLERLGDPVVVVPTTNCLSCTRLILSQLAVSNLINEQINQYLTFIQAQYAVAYYRGIADATRIVLSLSAVGDPG